MCAGGVYFVCMCVCVRVCVCVRAVFILCTVLLPAGEIKIDINSNAFS